MGEEVRDIGCHGIWVEIVVLALLCLLCLGAWFQGVVVGFEKG